MRRRHWCWTAPLNSWEGTRTATDPTVTWWSNSTAPRFTKFCTALRATRCGTTQSERTDSMTPDEQLARAERALGNTSVQQLFVRYRAIIGPAPDQMTAMAASALDALRNGKEPTPEQLQALEYAIRLMRPAPLVRHGLVDKLDPDTAGSFPIWESFSAAVRPILGAVGRIDRLATSGFESDEVGTG